MSSLSQCITAHQDYCNTLVNPLEIGLINLMKVSNNDVGEAEENEPHKIRSCDTLIEIQGV